MQYTYHEYPSFREHRFSIYDMCVDRIACGEDTVEFCFPDGFYLIENGQLVRTGRSSITLHCNEDEFFCHVIHRTATPAGVEYHGIPLSLTELSHLLEAGRKIELYQELFGYECLYWRGALLPYNQEGLTDQVEMELCGNFAMTYTWE